MPPTHPSSPLRSQLTSRLFTRWEQRQWTGLESMGATMARERRRRALLSGARVVVLAADGVLAYLLLTTHTH
jgi:hypothetical protein